MLDLAKKYKITLFQERKFAKHIPSVGIKIQIGTYMLRAYKERPWFDKRNSEQPIIVMIVNGKKAKWLNKLIVDLQGLIGGDEIIAGSSNTDALVSLQSIKDAISKCKYAKQYCVLWNLT